MLKFLDQLVPPLKSSTSLLPTTGIASGTPVTILHTQYQFDPMVMNNPLPQMKLSLMLKLLSLPMLIHEVFESTR